MRKILFFYLIPALLISVIACQRDDDEPPSREIKDISRLYISTSDYQIGASENLNNIYVIDQADEDSFPSVDSLYSYNSGAKGARTIHFAPNGGMIFQSSLNTPGTNDTSIYVMNVNIRGDISSRGKISNRRFDNIRGLYYTVVNVGVSLSNDYLLATNKSNRDANGNMYVFLRPQNSGAFRVPSFRLPLNFVPWALTVYEKDVFVVKTGTEGGVEVYKDLTQKFIDSQDTLLNVNPTFSLTVNGSRNLRGISYSRIKDILVMTDYSINGNVIEDGRILIFENFSSNTTTKEISPTRVIKGLTTKLKQPIDVAIDTRDGGKYIYVADPGAKSVFRYLISDEGDVAPNASLDFNGKTPESISLDTR
jgi:hypothetical protein